ncbi:hypothetical protein EJ04DRAFT_589252 [Polyplosphaeria fusca]|uniref:Heterokaryon incompatibility domain-containing protein n=1 Tax=Polyplosphaeria fusca TaxID=682080 RepID=A0A9P4QPY1_9PLEO|nr:hypothetical protein EJ04DRAFT_589252 [Polyplosphaeria fusca]
MSIPSPPAAFPTDWSLAAIADRLPPLPFERSDGSVEAQDRELPHPLCFWYRLNYYIGTQHSKLPQFAPEQWASYQLLHDWWTAKYQDASFSLAAALRVLDYSGTLLNADELTEESKRAFDAIFSHLRLKRWPIGDILDPEPRQLPQSLNQHYHDRLWELFRCEFLFESCYYPCRENETNFATRRGARNTATVYGYCQQLGWLAFSEGLSGSSKPEELPLKTTERADNDAIFNIAINGPVLKPCPWLDKEELDDLQNLPRFLWDIEACCTMDTLLIEPRPDYIAISHTWGRWATGERVSIEGVSWLIPTNTRFDVEDLPQILKRAPGNIRYIWLDLLCIPQDGSKIGAQEIARQAKIFRGARLAIAWLSEVHSLEGLGSIIRWMSLELMLVHGQRNEEQRARAVDAAWSAVSGKVSGLLEPREGSLQFGNLALNPWFTSLWTLQEVLSQSWRHGEEPIQKVSMYHTTRNQRNNATLLCLKSGIGDLVADWISFSTSTKRP